MEFSDDFYHIGSEFIDDPSIPEEKKDIRLVNKELLLEQEDKLLEIKRSTPIIFVNPDPSLEKPHNSTEAELVSDVATNGINVKDMFLRCVNILKETDKTLASTYDKYKLDVNKRKYIDVIFRKAMQSNYSYVNCKYCYKSIYTFDNLVNIFNGIRKAITTINFQKEETFIRAIRLLGESFISEIDKELHTNLRDIIQEKYKDFYNELNSIIDYELKHDVSVLEIILSKTIAKKYKWKEQKQFIGEILDDTKYIDDFLQLQENMIKSYQDYRLIQKKYFDHDAFNKVQDYLYTPLSDKLAVILQFLYLYITAACTIAIDLNMDFQNIMFLLEPTSSRIKSTRLVDLIETDKNVYISSDYHLLRELLSGNNTDISRSKEMIRLHNKYVKPNYLFLFLGDISEQEFYDINNKTYKEYLNLLIKLCNQLNGKKIIITGNNDTGMDNFYKKLGFEEIIREPVLLGRHVFSHEPIATEEGILNVHGHIHGSKTYWNIDPEYHIDAYIGLHGHPVTLDYLDNYYNSGKYKGCKTVYEWNDEEKFF